jgi:hypothetical protein
VDAVSELLIAEVELVDGLPPGLDHKDWVGYWQRSLEPLRQHPGRWARITRMRSRFAGGVANGINRKRLKMPPGIWRASVRAGQLYVCFCGDMPTPKAAE